MASFSFGAGNAGKLARLPVYAAGRLFTLMIPRTRDRWVFGSAAGLADGGWALWQEAVDRHGADATWLTGTPAEADQARALGIRFAPKHSLRGFLLTARARVIVVTHGFGDVNRYAVAGGFVVQLWHGIPLKRIGLDSPETLRSRFLPRSRAVRAVLRIMYRRAAAGIRVLPAASELVRGRLESAFALPDGRVVVTGEPRVDVLSAGTAAVRRENGRRLIAAATGPLGAVSRCVLYAPTWRDGDADPSIPRPEEWRRIVDVLEQHDAVLLVRPHHLGAGRYTPPADSDRVRMMGVDRMPDVTPALPGLDVLITDYSSLAYDAGLVPLPVLFLAPDEAAYAARRGFYGTYADVAGPDPAEGWDAVCRQLAAVLADPAARAERIARSERLSARVHAYHDGGNTARVHRVIRAALSSRSKGPA
ncbi:CDP-glycerol glycerophosphotransferase family protein [Microbacterium sp. zg.Y1090]|uniref:CDP-glycerol glycerophosphotransferase family protein n=1 Tax=Microbacterium TaxID=33882 RepID=UPI00214C3C98|nr:MULTISPECIES: CDP-glycerol glycerophosphotransferase family protein [unclassified Microbacterium]MCR2812039.1 CDP-glycerol glycerophosphotransferase family protein [Microbacterium sp. zg.Y1084]MCR2818522.1 CDP-glycerol glycerophosphotransferase family protein [Microbacterium sp. zg.Y1090]MDL5486335.1 CDP-glycerol glycerophosphotransferase family protein [Microbacterium sp. zg-Y1211]WIM29530.1 CDP-glycerol glycerophosphotransferase family protein [Microbacterium sp. zg-Y1090]